MNKHKKTEKTEQSVMADFLLLLAALSLVAVYYYGARAALVIAVSLAACVTSDMLCIRFRKKKADASDFAASAVTGLTLALMLPASVPYHIAVAAAVFAAVIGRQAFGGRGNEIFNPAAVGFLFIALCFSDAALNFPAPFERLTLTSVIPADGLSQSVNKTLLATSSPPVTGVMELLIGKFPAPMGTPYLIFLAVCAPVLLLRRSASAVSFLTQFIIITGFSYIYFDYSLLSVLNLHAGSMLLFGLVFLTCGRKKVNRTRFSWFLLGVVTAVLFIAFEFYAKAENAVVCAAIIAAPVGIELDRQTLALADALNKKSGFIFKIRTRLNKQLVNVNETLNMLEEKDADKKDKTE